MLLFHGKIANFECSFVPYSYRRLTMALSCSRSLLVFLFFLTVLPTARGGDLKVVSVARRPNGDTYTLTQYYKGERTRREWRDLTTWKPGLVTYGPLRAAIYQCDARRALDLNLKSHKYAIFELNEDCKFKSAPPRPAPKGTMDVYIEAADTGERRQILGQT